MVSGVPVPVLALKHGRDSRLIPGPEGLGFHKPEQKWKRIFFMSSFNRTFVTWSGPWGEEAAREDIQSLAWRCCCLDQGQGAAPTIDLPDFPTQASQLQWILPAIPQREARLLGKRRGAGPVLPGVHGKVPNLVPGLWFSSILIFVGDLGLLSLWISLY